MFIYPLISFSTHFTFHRSEWMEHFTFILSSSHEQQHKQERMSVKFELRFGFGTVHRSHMLHIYPVPSHCTRYSMSVVSFCELHGGFSDFFRSFIPSLSARCLCSQSSKQHNNFSPTAAHCEGFLSFSIQIYLVDVVVLRHGAKHTECHQKIPCLSDCLHLHCFRRLLS